jgi:hypothetical protein
MSDFNEISPSNYYGTTNPQREIPFVLIRSKKIQVMMKVQLNYGI